jgi:hypothetical protein
MKYKKKTKKKLTKTKKTDNSGILLKDAMLSMFEICLEEVQKPSPSISGTVAGMDFKQFSAFQLIFYIKEQENLISYLKKYEKNSVKKEDKLLKSMIKKAKKVLGRYYDEWYAAQ